MFLFARQVFVSAQILFASMSIFCCRLIADEMETALSSARGLEISVVDSTSDECSIDVHGIRRGFEIELMELGIPLSRKSPLKL